MKRNRSSIRLKLTVATLAPLAVAIVLFFLIGSSLITSRILAQAQSKVSSDLNSAHEMLISEQARLGEVVRLLSISPELPGNIEEIHSSPAAQLLSATNRNVNLAFLTVVDRFGIVRYRAANPSKSGDHYKGKRLLESAMNGKAVSGLMMISPEDARLENPTLPGVMHTKVKVTPHARPASKSVEDRGLMLVSAYPLRSENGMVVGVVCGGILLNSYNDLVEKITRVIFNRSEGIGNATIFLGDVRVATTVVDEEGNRAIGTRMSEEVYKSIIKGEKWVGRAFVLNTWNYSAYEPLIDIQGDIVGALYVGTPERPFVELRERIRLIFGGVILIVTILGVSLSATLGERMARPVQALEEGARRIAFGETLPDIHVNTNDEIAALADEFNMMKNKLQKREEEILHLNRTLEQKVLERAAQLEEQGARLLDAQAELARSERLAGLGMLSAGVAHEINNPLAIIRGNTELLEMSSAEIPEISEEVDTIMRQVGRIERIVRNLLVFSRGVEKQTALLSLNAILDEIIDQLHHQLSLEGYLLKRVYRNTEIRIEGDEDQLRQVFTNLILNGLQAMKEGGTLAVAASVDTKKGICLVSISDAGPGIGEDQKEKLFTPFYTTKRGGTGLGLAVSYGIVKDHGGEIHVSSRSGEGAVFCVELPLRQAA